MDETAYGADVTLIVSQPAGNLEALNAVHAEATAGQVYAEEMEQKVMGRRVK